MATTSATLTGAPTKHDVRVHGRAPAAVLYIPAPHEHVPVQARLNQMGLDVTQAEDAADAIRLLRKRPFAIVFVHLADDRSATSAIRAIRAQHPHVSMAGVMDPGRPLVTADALRAGVGELLAWPLDEHDVATLISNAEDRMSTASDAAPDMTEAVLFANSAAMRLLIEQVRSAAAESVGVLLCGERGSGRELVARTIHARSAYAAGPFVVVDCAGPLHELETRLFGLITDRRPAPGPERRSTERVGRSGAVYLATGGTLFLKNIVDAPTRVQAKLARLLRDREAGLEGDRTIVDLDFRPIAAIDSGLDAAMADERVRRDLFERVAQIRIDVPAFRRRREDIPLIAVSVLNELCQKHKVASKTCSRAALVLLSALPWPGNGRELRTLFETLLLAVPRPVIQLDDLFEHIRLDGLAARVDAGGTLRDAKASFERDWISAVLMKHHGRVGEAAKALGIQRTNLYRKVRQLKVARTLLGPRKVST